MKKEYLQGVSDANLIQMYCNVLKTKRKSDDHLRIRQCTIRWLLIQDEILSRELEIPEWEEVMEKGILNGEVTF